MESLPHSEEITAVQSLGNLWSRFNQGSFDCSRLCQNLPMSEYFNILTRRKKKAQHDDDDEAGAAWFLLSFSWRLLRVSVLRLLLLIFFSFARCKSQSRFWFNLLIVLMTMLNAETFQWINCVTICANNCSWSALCFVPFNLSQARDFRGSKVFNCRFRLVKYFQHARFLTNSSHLMSSGWTNLGNRWLIKNYYKVLCNAAVDVIQMQNIFPATPNKKFPSSWREIKT